MKLTDLIGKKVSKIRFKYKVEANEGLQTFQSHIKLDGGDLILFPTDPEDQVELTQHYKNSKEGNFALAKRCGLAYRLVFKKKQIVDVHFKYMEGAHYNDTNGIIELENGKYLMEENQGPVGTNIGLQVLNKSEFDALNHDGIELRSFKNDLANA